MERRVFGQKVTSGRDQNSLRSLIHGPQDPGGYLRMMLFQAMAEYEQEIRGIDLFKPSGVATFNQGSRDVI